MVFIEMAPFLIRLRSGSTYDSVERKVHLTFRPARTLCSTDSSISLAVWCFM